MYMLQKADDVPSQGRTRKCVLQILDDGAHAGFAVDSLHDFSGAARELDHAFRIEQDETLLCWLPLEAEMALKFENRIVRECRGIRLTGFRRHRRWFASSEACATT